VSATSGVFAKQWKFNVPNKLVRFNFLEAIVRIAKSKYQDLEIQDGCQKLIEEHIIPYTSNKNP